MPVDFLRVYRSRVCSTVAAMLGCVLTCAFFCLVVVGHIVTGRSDRNASRRGGEEQPGGAEAVRSRSVQVNSRHDDREMYSEPICK